MKIRRVTPLAVAVGSSILSTGCVNYPLQFTKAQWMSMSPAEQEPYRQRDFLQGAALTNEIQARVREFESTMSQMASGSYD